MTATATKTKNETILEVAELLARATVKEQLDYLKQTYGEEAVRLAWLGLSGIVKRRLYRLCANGSPSTVPPTVSQMTTTPQTAPVSTQVPPQVPETPKANSAAGSPKLWELAEDVNALDEMITELEDNDEINEQERDELLELFLTEWFAASDNFDQKAENVALYIKHQEAVSEAQKAESRRLWALGEKTENGAKRLRKYLTAYCLKVGRKSIKGFKVNLSIRKKPAKVILTVEPEQLPEDLKEVEVTPKLAKIKEYLKEHPDCDFAAFSILEEFSVTIR